MIPKSRQDNTYCKKSPFSDDGIINIGSMDYLKEVWYGTDDEDELYNFMTEHYNDTRYRGFNLHSYFGQRTIEIRFHSSTSDFEKIINWIKINLSIVDWAISHSVNDITRILTAHNCKTNYGIIRYLFKEVIQNNVLWTYYKKRFNKFNDNKVIGYYYKQEKKFDGQVEELDTLENSNHLGEVLGGLNEATENIQ